MNQRPEGALRLLLALDEHFEQLAAISICSFLAHNSIEEIVVVTPDTTELRTIPKIACSFQVPLQHLSIPGDAACHRLPNAIKPYFFCIEAMEIACHGALAENPGRYLYVDADTLCIRSIHELTHLRLDAHLPLAACSHGRPMPDRQLILDLESHYHYFNAGVMLFDSQSLATSFNSQEITAYYIDNQALCRFREQCALNAVLRKRILYLPNQYNYLSWMRPRVANGAWHQPAVNSMAYCLESVRQELAIVHLSAGAIPNRINEDRHEAVDRYWLELYTLVKQEGWNNERHIKTFMDFTKP